MAPRTHATRYANHPIVKYVRSMPEELYLTREAADQLNCSKGYLKMLPKTTTVHVGPTHQAQYGAKILHLYTPTRIEAIRVYMKELSGIDKGLGRRGPTRLWTKSETISRQRAFARMRTYTLRAVEYRNAGRTDRALDMETRAAALRDSLETARAARYKKVHGSK